MGKRVGIIGGGQLGMMMTEAAHQLGFQVVVLDPTPQCPCGLIAEEQIVAEYNDESKISELCQKSDFITYEFENVPFTSVKKWKKEFNIPQGEMPLYLSQHRLREKRAAAEAGAAVGEYCGVHSKDELFSAINRIGYPAILKTCSGGYDGKGQLVLHSEKDLPAAIEMAEKVECILEQMIPFDCEISVIVTRSIHGEMTTLPITQNIHKDNILFISTTQTSLSTDILAKADEMARAMMTRFDFVGTLAIEMFVIGDNVLFNEMAPRPHNSGHYSIEGCETSQFEQHIRAITGLPLGKTTLIQPATMVNYLGQHVHGIQKLKEAKLPNVFIHDYQKTKAITNRKMGHITFLDYSMKKICHLVKHFWK